MKRQVVLVLVLVAMVLIGFGAYFLADSYQNRQDAESSAQAAALVMTDFSSGDVTRVEIHAPDLDYVIDLDDETGTWTVTEGEYSYINTYYINTLCSYGASLTAEQILENPSSDLGEYGLSDPIIITYETDDAAYTIRVGNQTGTGEYFYMTVEGRDEIFLVDSDTAGYLAVNETQLRNRYVVDDSTASFTRLRLSNGEDIIYDLEWADDAWNMRVPADVPIEVDGAAVSSLTISLQQLEIDAFGDQGVTSLANPGYTYYFEQENGNTVTLIFEEYDPLTTSYIHCLHEETGEEYIFDSSYLSFLQNSADDYLVTTLYAPTMNTVQSLEISYDGSFNDTAMHIDTTFSIDYENSTYACDGVDFSDSRNTVSAWNDLYDRVTGIAYETFQPDAEDPGYDAADVTMTLTYTLTDDSVHTLELVPYEENLYWAYIDGAFSFASVRQRTLSGNDMFLERYTDFQEAFAHKDEESSETESSEEESSQTESSE